MIAETELKRKRAYIRGPKYTVTATVVGRFDHKLRAAHERGFGNGGWNSQLVLESVHNVVARPFKDDFFTGKKP